MKIAMISGSHPRHLHVVRQIASTGYLTDIVFMKREKFVRDIPNGLEGDLKELYVHHFALRDEMEGKYFGHKEIEDENLNANYIFIEPRELNSSKVEQFLRDSQCDTLITYGPNIIKDNILQTVNGNAFNLHGGLSPYYKGSATMFWPFYFLEPNYVGTTFHYITNKIDAGNIVHQTLPTLSKGDCMHEVSCKAIYKAAEELKEVVRLMAEGTHFEGVRQTKTGKLFLVKDWRPEHLRTIYETYDDKIVDLYLDGKINQGNNPNIIRAYE